MALAKQLELSDEDRKKLETIIKKRTLQAQVVDRARMLLYKADGWAVAKIAETLNVNINTVNLCLRKFKEDGIERALNDDARSGRRPRITDDDKAWVTSIACGGPREVGLPQELWTYKALTAYIRECAVAAGHPVLEHVSETKVFRILADQDIHPQKIRYYCEKRDPDFDSKMHDVLVVYKQVEMQFDDKGNVTISDISDEDEPDVHTVSCDEKPGIQVLKTSGELHPDARHGYIGRDYEYRRLGTISLLAGLDLQTGIITPILSDTHNSDDFIQLLNELDKQYPEKDIIRIVCDNHTIHKSKQVKEYLAEKPGRFDFVFTPKHGSWLNIIETVFSRLTKQMLKGARADSKEELKERIRKYFEDCNKDPVVFRWYYKMDEISEEEAKGLKAKVTNDATDAVAADPPVKTEESTAVKKPRGRAKKTTEDKSKKTTLKKGRKETSKANGSEKTMVSQSTIKSQRTRKAQKDRASQTSDSSTSTANSTI